jgi:uncharacterized membrane protein
MTLYLWLKFVRVISSTILFGTGIGTACTMLYGHNTKNIQVIAAITGYAVLADWVFTASSALIQPLTGFWMVYLADYPWTSLWIIGSIIGYLVAGLCWLPVVYLQIKIHDYATRSEKSKSPLPPIYFRYFKYWFFLG